LFDEKLDKITHRASVLQKRTGAQAFGAVHLFYSG